MKPKKDGKAAKRYFTVAYVFACSFIMLCFGAYLIRTAVDGSFSRYDILPITALLLALLALVLMRILPRPLKYSAFIGMYAWIISFALLSAQLFIFASGQERLVAEADRSAPVTVLVFGCRTHGYDPGKALRGRLEEARQLLEEFPEAVCVVSGGQGENETVSEAEAMKHWLVEAGIAEERIYTEDRSVSTEENIAYSLALIREHGLPESVIGVSSRYHLSRISTIAGESGMEDILLCPADTDGPTGLFINLVREYMATVKHML